jgi:hypothetical protein
MIPPHVLLRISSKMLAYFASILAVCVSQPIFKLDDATTILHFAHSKHDAAVFPADGEIFGRRVVAPITDKEWEQQEYQKLCSPGKRGYHDPRPSSDLACLLYSFVVAPVALVSLQQWTPQNLESSGPSSVGGKSLEVYGLMGFVLVVVSSAL